MRRQSLLISLALVGLAFPSGSVAQTFTWTDPTGGSYDSVLDWSPIGVPDTPGEAAEFNLPDTYTMSIDTSGDTVGVLRVFDGDVTFVSSNINKTYTANLTQLLGGDLTIDRPGSGAITYQAPTTEISAGSTLTARVANTVLDLDGFVRLGSDSSNTPGFLTVEAGAALDLDQGAQVFIGDNASGGFGQKTVTGAGTTATGAVTLLVGSLGPGRYEVRDGAVATHYGANLGVGAGTSAIGSRLLVDGGATLSLEDPDPGFFNVGITTIERLTTVDVLTGGRFEAGFFSSTSSTTNIDGAGSVMRALDFGLLSSTVNVTDGGRLEIASFGGEFLGQGSRLNVGGGSTVLGAAEVFVGSTGSPARVEITGGSQWTTNGAFGNLFSLFLGNGIEEQGELLVDNSTFNAGNGELVLASGTDSRGEAEFRNGAAGTVERLDLGRQTGGDAVLTLDNASLTATLRTRLGVIGTPGDVTDEGAALVRILPGALLDLRQDVLVGVGATIELYGGELRFSDLARIQGTGGTVDWNNGRVAVTDDTTLTPFAASLLTPDGVLGFGQELAVEGTLTLQSTLRVDGGKLSVLGLTSPALLQLQSGTFEFLDDDLTIGAGGPLGEQFEMRDGLTLANDQDVIVSGLLVGRGMIDAGFGVSASGEARLGAGDRMTVTGFSSNSGRLELLGGRLDAEGGLTNNATGDIVGRGTIDAGGAGFTNRGDLALSNGQTDVFGDVANVTTGRVLVSGEADVTFWDDVTDTGAAFNVSAGSSVTFFGQAGFGVSGGGDVYFEADITPGSSPGLEVFGGNVFLGLLSTLQIEIAGVTKGAGYDSLDIAGIASLLGALDVELLDGFQPVLGDVFEVLTAAGGVSGAFLAESLPALADPLLAWRVDQGPDAISLVIAPTLAGDYNADGIVDAADYTVWRDTEGTSGLGLAADGDGDGDVDADDYQVWVSQFGQSFAPSLAVPEASAASLALMVVAFAGLRRRVHASEARRVSRA